MSNLTLDHLKNIVQSAIASATRWKPNLTITDPEDPRYVTGAKEFGERVANAQGAANEARTAANEARTEANKARTEANTVKTAANIAYTTAVKAVNKADSANAIGATVVGLIWEKGSDTIPRVNAAVYNDGIIVAATEEGIYYSADGISWRVSNAPTVYFTRVLYANGVWIAGGLNASTAPTPDGIYYSTDGISWAQSNLTSGELSNAGHFNGLWVAGFVRNSGVYYSSDGMTWMSTNITDDYISYIAYSNGMWVAANYNAIYYSSDGMSWTKSDVLSPKCSGVQYTNGMWVARGSSAVYLSNDGKTWQKYTTNASFYVINYSENLWTAASGDGIYYSQDAKSWRRGVEGNFSTLTYANGLWVASTNYYTTGSKGIYYSENGMSWNQSNIQKGYAYPIAYLDGVWIAGTAYYSFDGKNWESSRDTLYSSWAYGPFIFGDLWTMVEDKTLYCTRPTRKYATPTQLAALESRVETLETPNDYELIESITLEEDVAQVIRTTEPSGDALSLSHLYLKLTSPAYTENRVIYFAIGNTDATDIWAEDRLMYGADSNVINENGYSTEVFCEKERGIFRNWMLSPANVVTQVNARCNHSIRTGSIKAIRIFAFSNTTDLIPAGTQIEIWGVRG